MLRGEDLLPSTPRQIVLYRALAQIGVGERACADLRAPADRSRRRQPAVVQAGQGVGPGRVPRAGLSARGAAELPGPARLGDRRRPRRLHHRRRWCRPSTSGGSTPTRPSSTPRSARRSTPRTSGGCRPTSWPTSWCRSWSAPGWSAIRRLPEQGSLLVGATPLIQERMTTLSEGVDLLGVPVPRRRRARDRRRGRAERRRRRRCWTPRRRRCGRCEPFDHASIEAALRAALIDGAGAEAEAGLRSGPGRGHRTADLAAAVRVAGAARSGVGAGPDRRGPRPAWRGD